MNPILLLAILTALVGLLWRLEAHPFSNRWFRILPLPFWCYMLPMLGTTLGWLPSENRLYPFLSQQLLPICLVLLLINADLKGLVRLGPLAIKLMLIGSAGTIAGGLIGFALYRRWLPAGSWAGVGALTASWIGGSANLLAVKEALQVPDPLIAPIILVDAVVAYSWMAFLVWGASLKEWWQEFAGTGIEAAHQPAIGIIRAGGNADPLTRTARFPRLISVLGLSLLVSGLAQIASRWLPTVGQGITASTWTVLLVTTTTLALSLTPLRELGQAGSSRTGTFALFLLLASIGARANFRAILDAPAFLALGVTWILIHGGCLVLAGYWLKAPLGLMATASQANIGGPISAPIVGATYDADLAGIGLLMAILGNVLGTYLGLATALLTRSFSF